MNRDLSNYRKSYEKHELSEANIPRNPMTLFNNWFNEADQSELIGEANAVTLSTLGEDGYPSSRIVLIKQFDESGFVFYTNYDSKKGKAISNNSKVCLSFFWPELERQVIIRGNASKVDASDSDAYFNSRPKGSQLGALVSNQSQVIEDRKALDDRLSQLEKEYSDKPVKRPKHWGGFVVLPEYIEFWQGRMNRLHDRFLFSKNSDNLWIANRLSP